MVQYYDTWLFGKKFFLIYTTTKRKHRQIPLVHSYYTVSEWCATFNSHNALLSVQILKYSSLRFGCFFCGFFFFLNNELCWTFRYRGLCYCFLLYFSYSQLLIRFQDVQKKQKQKSLNTEDFWNSHSYISTGSI